MKQLMRIGPISRILFKKRGALIILIAGGMLISCGKKGTTRFSVGANEFEVPNIYISDHQVPWLPKEKVGSFAFILNPGAPLPQQVAVRVEQPRVCGNSKMKEGGVYELACGFLTKPGGEIEISESLPVSKSYPDVGDRTRWLYEIQATDGKRYNIASCYSSDHQDDGLCTMPGSYSGVVYTVSLPDRDMVNIVKIRGRVRELLGAWSGGRS